MWVTLALMTALAPVQAPKLELANARATHGVLGQERKDTKVLPGDQIVVAFDIAGLKVMNGQLVTYSIGMELIDKTTGKAVFKKEAEKLEAVLNLGNDRLPTYAFSVVSLDTMPGPYDMKVTVTDLATKQAETLIRTFEVLKSELGVVRVGFTYDTRQVAPGVGVLGQTLWANFSVVGFKLDQADNPDLSIEMQIVDEATGKPTQANPFAGEVKKLAGPMFKKIITFEPMPIHLSRTGKFKVVIKATDNLSGKKVAEQTLNLTVLDPNK
jgi:hypothetical protein